jgi:amino acid adenylation domain-containing protein/non-ribosomal peptide synthase protein (TIGR01720 family)
MPQNTLQGFKLSPQQRRSWTLQPERDIYRARATFALTGEIDRERLWRAVGQVAGQHETLRTVFLNAAVLSVPLQAVVEPAFACAAAGAGGLDFERGPLVSFELVEAGEGRAALAVSAPSLLLDAGSLAVLFAEIAEAYAGGGADGEDPLQYLEFCAWQSELLQSADDELLQAKAFWARQELPARDQRLMGEPAPGSLEEFAPEFVDVEVADELTREVEEAAAALGATPRIVLLSAWVALVSRFTGSEAPAVGATFDGRKFEDFSKALGPFAQTLPLRVRIEDGLAFADLVARVSEVEGELRYWQEYAPWDLGFEQERARLVYPFAFELEAWPEDRAAGGATFAFADQWICSEPFRFRLSCLHRPGGLRLRIGYDAAGTGAGHARELGGSFATLLRDAVRQPAAAVRDLEVLAEPGFARLVIDFNRAAPLPPDPLLLHERASRQAARRPEALAVVDAERALTWEDLEVRSNRLAHHLRALGAGPEVRVALWLERSADLVVALLAVLKSGAAYVPLDPSFPSERLALMMEESGAPILVTQSALAPGLPPLPARVVELERESAAIERCGAEMPASGVEPENLAYVLFTSGSTGRPKGVAVEHRQVTAYLDAILARMAPEDAAAYAVVSTFAADLGNTVIFPALATGGCLHVIGHEEARNPEALAARFASDPIDVLKIVPSHLEALLSAGSPERVLPRRLLVVGGEAASAALVAELRRAASRGLRVLNHYGPTETTVGVMTHPVTPDVEGGAPLPLGQPLGSARIYLLDSRLRPVPTGMPGEIHIGGAGVSRGYLGRPDLTAERFIPDPFGAPGSRLYRSGDLARFRPDGAVEFIGRVDHQVKIRGYRIELAEIDATLRRHPEVREAVAMVREDRPGERRLVGYVVPKRAGGTFPPADLRTFAARWLPEAMIPAAFCPLAALPLTANGKVDRAALPAPERQLRTGGAEGPRGAVEETLAAIWSQVLGIERVGIHDNFFELGGDSILVIQVVARAARAGLRLQPKQMFERQTLADLAAVAESSSGPAAAEEVGGDAPLTPIEHWFFEQGFADPHHWNQAALYEVREGVRPDLVSGAFAAIYRHHDALRLRFEPAAAGWRQRIAEAEPLPFEVVDLAGADAAGTLERIAAETHTSLDLSQGPLVRAVFLDGGAVRSSRLLLVFHHLVIDGVSWRILIEDFVAACEEIMAGAGATLPARTTPFPRWAERLAAFTEAGGFDGELAHWEACSGGFSPLPVDGMEGETAIASERSLALSLSAEETSALLQEVPAAFRTQINDVLLAALARVLCRWTGRDRVAVDLEGHGREDLFEEIDLTRTVGWFTTHYPVVLEAGPGDDPGGMLVAAKEALRTVPRRGIGFGALRYLRGAAVAARLQALPQPQVSFNYLGQFDQAGPESTFFTRAAERAGSLRSPRGHRTHLLGVVGRVAGGVLEVVWRYSENRHRRETVEELAQGYLHELRRIVDHCRSRTETVLSPADFDLAAGLSREQLERIARQVGQAKV